MKKTLILAAVLLLGAIAFPQVLAEEPAAPPETAGKAEPAGQEGRPMVLRFGFQNMYHKGTDFGLGLDFDWFFGENLSLNPAIGMVKYTKDTNITPKDSWKEGNSIPFSLGLNIHQPIRSRSDLHLGPLVAAWSIPGGDTAFCLGWVVGADFGIGKSKWAASAQGRYLREWNGDTNGFFFRLGAAYRF